MAGGNLKTPPLALTPGLVAKLVGARPALGKGIAHLPIEGTAAGCRTCVQPRQERCTYRACPIGDRP
jgi:hypothetical protein